MGTVVEVGIKIKRGFLLNLVLQTQIVLAMQKKELMEVDPPTHGVKQQTNLGAAVVVKEDGNHSANSVLVT